MTEFPPSQGGLGWVLFYFYMAEKDNKTKSFVLRVDADTMAAIEKWAADEFRSTNGQLQWIIAEALKKSGRMKKRSLPLTPSRRGGTSESTENK